MTTYVWTATDKSGQKIVKEIEAATAEDAKFVLLAQGYANLELKQDEVGSIALAGFPKRKSVSGAEIKITAEEKLKHRNDPTVTFRDVLRKGIVRSYLFLGALIFFAIYSAYRGHRVYSLFYGIALLVWLAYILFIGLQSVYYRKLIKAADWNQWRKVLRLVTALKIIGRFRAVKLPASELTRYRAKALAGLGLIDEALQEYKVCEGRPDCPSWLYKLFVGSLYNSAKQYDQAIECNLASIREKPTSTAYLDLALRYARFKHDPVRARAAMAEAEKSTLTDIARPFHLRCRGIIAYLEGDYVAAGRDFKTAIELVEKARGRPFRDGQLGITRAYLCCALASQGDVASAKKCFALAKRYLIATKEDELLAQCRKSTGES